MDTKEFIEKNYWWDKDSHFSDIVLNGNEDIKREYILILQYHIFTLKNMKRLKNI